jgi:hypothetical protein
MATDYGTDISCVNDFAPDGRITSGRHILAEAICRRLITPRGRLIDDPNYGFDLTGYTNDDMSPGDIAAMRVGIEAECLKDERVSAAVATASLAAGGILAVGITLTDGNGPFSLVLSVSATTISILSVT